MVQLLADGGGAKDKVNDYGHTPILCAAENGHGDVVKLLIGMGADKDMANISGIHLFTVRQLTGIEMWFIC